ncbi:unnamed protein product [Didymodactylos carnosus]|uniref:Uncharacterized protein n=2 Tax=Didymodactylos carnosus TaxID=1234261 RepID=A0A814YJY5_9BILA|nr:unnamed protein product [Didymodactylos carnosus]CAF3993620.1 unnamed protein product [Didymodactylos carnosus]
MRRDLNTPCLPTDTLFHQFIRETHHHLSINHPQQRHNNDYQTTGMKLVATYPKLESKQTRTSWIAHDFTGIVKNSEQTLVYAMREVLEKLTTHSSNQLGRSVRGNWKETK